MIKKDISKILTSGSAKQRMLLVVEDGARRNYNQERILTDHEFNAISESFKTSAEVRLWNKFYRLDRRVAIAIVNLQVARYEVLVNYSDLRGYILVWNSIENAELLANSILHEIKDTKERKLIAQRGALGINLLFSKTEPDEEGYIEIKTDFEKDSPRDENGKLLAFKDKPRKTKEYSLWYVMNNVKKQTEEAVIKYLSWRQAILDVMEEEGFNVKAYKEAIKKMDESVYRPIIGWDKYLSNEETLIREQAKKRVDKLKNKYAITPNLKELNVNEEIRAWYKKNMLRDE